MADRRRIGRGLALGKVDDQRLRSSHGFNALPKNHLPLRLPRPLLIFVISGVFATGIFSQTPPGKPAARRIEPGLENAVKWKWRVAPSDEKDWGLELPNLTRPLPANTPASALSLPEDRATLYEVKRGDALILIGKRFGVTVAQIKEFNGLKDDKIRIGQMLKIPAVAEPSATTPPSQSGNTHRGQAGETLRSKAKFRDGGRVGECQAPGFPGPRAVLGGPDRRQTGSGV